MSAPWRVLGAVLVVASLSTASARTAHGQADKARATFDAMCAPCHTIGGGRLVGPDLQGVTERRTEAWLIEFVQQPQRLASAGDTAAAALFAEYQMPMPDQPLSADEIRGILAYIGGAAPAPAAAPAATPPAQAGPAAAAAPSPEEQIRLGQNLFRGTTPFVNGGPACVSCHDVTHQSVVAGGAFARELTTSVPRLGGAGVRAIVANPPFPMMQRAYRDRPLAEQETAALVGFLTSVGEQQAAHQARGVVLLLVLAGFGGTALLLALYSLVWGRRLKVSVNQRIFDRQLEST